MRPNIYFSCLVLLGFLMLHPRSSAQTSAHLIILHAAIIDVKKGTVLWNTTIQIDSGKITAINTGAAPRHPAQATIIDAKGKYVIPGLWDMHVHITRGLWSDPKKTFALMIANGVTGIREMGGYLTTIKRWKEQIRSGVLAGPRIMAAGPILFGDKTADPSHIGVPGPEVARHIVDSLHDAGVDFIKVYNYLNKASYYAIASESQKLHLSFEGHVPLSVTVIEAADAGQKSIEHLDNPFLFEECAHDFERFRQMDLERIYQLSKPFSPLSVQAWLEHMHYIDTALMQFDERKADIIYEHLVQHQTWQCPTMITLRMLPHLRDSALWEDSLLQYAPWPAARSEWDYRSAPLTANMQDREYAICDREYMKCLQVIKDMQKRQIPFLTGTDLGNPFVFPGFSVHRELQLFVEEAGFTSLQALQTATINPALFFGLEDSLGTVAVGKYADLVILNGNPLTDIHNMTHIDGVIVNGKRYGRSELDQMLKEVTSKR